MFPKTLALLGGALSFSEHSSILTEWVKNRCIVTLSFREGPEDVFAHGIVESFGKVEGVAMIHLQNFYRSVSFSSVQRIEVLRNS